MHVHNPTRNGRYRRPGFAYLPQQGSDIRSGELHFQRRPAANIMEQENSFTIELAAPGLKKESFSINLKNKVLTISTQAENPVSGEAKRKEFDYSNFNRSFTLNEAIDVDQISASYEAGILTVTLPKRPEMKDKQINIQ